jgi:hypothetical protein
MESFYGSIPDECSTPVMDGDWQRHTRRRSPSSQPYPVGELITLSCLFGFCWLM